jgi:hypothetical protein
MESVWTKKTGQNRVDGGKRKGLRTRQALVAVVFCVFRVGLPRNAVARGAWLWEDGKVYLFAV